MNTPIFPAAAVVMAVTAQTQTDVSGWLGIAERYGVTGLMLLALGAYTIWNQKQTRKREDEANAAREERDQKDREERKEHLSELVSVIEKKDAEILRLSTWIMERQDR